MLSAIGSFSRVGYRCGWKTQKRPKGPGCKSNGPAPRLVPPVRLTGPLVSWLEPKPQLWVPLTVAVGAENRDTWYGAAAVWLAERPLPRAYRRAGFHAISESTRDDLVARGVSAERIRVELEPTPLLEKKLLGSDNATIFVPFTTFQRAFNFGDEVGWFALTGRESGPEMAGLLERMGKERAIARLRAAAER